MPADPLHVHVEHNVHDTALMNANESSPALENPASTELAIRHETPTQEDEEEDVIDHVHHHAYEIIPEKLGIIPLAVIVFYSTSGGPFGVEGAVRSGGNFFALLGFLVMPLVWSVQEAMMTAELGSAFQEASGGVAWVEAAFGTRAGWISGYLGWIAGATDNAIYPVLFLDYLLQVMNSDGGEDDLNPSLRFALLSATSIGLAFINWLGLPVVGRMSVLICLIAMSPFFILTVVGVFQVEPHRWFQMPSGNVSAIEEQMDDDIGGGLFPEASFGGILWRPFLNNLFWNLNSFDAAGSFAADIEDPGRVLPRAMYWALVMVFAGYFFPLLVAIGASDVSQEEWVNGYLGRAASIIVGPWLGGWTVFAAAISNIALFQAELSADAFQLMGMADRGYLPRIFSTRSRHGTPTYGIILGTAIIVVLGASRLDQLIEMLNFNYAISLLLEYFAFVKLRISRPEMQRPFRVPLNTAGCIVALIPTMIATFAVLGLATYTTYLFSIAVNLVGLLIYLAKQRGIFRKSLFRTSMVDLDVSAPATTATMASERDYVPVSPTTLVEPEDSDVSIDDSDDGEYVSVSTSPVEPGFAVSSTIDPDDGEFVSVSSNSSNRELV